MDSGDALTAQGEFVAKMLTGSQRKTAYALRQNVESLIAGHNRKKFVEITTSDGKTQGAYLTEKPENLHCVGFLTLTLGDWRDDLTGHRRFEKIYDAAEASRRLNNLNRRVLSDLFEKAVIVTERHKDRGIHFHIVGILRGRPDIRTGFDFEAFREIRATGKKFSAADVGASPELADKWKFLRETLPKYGFGRAELTPIEKRGEAVAAYVSKYIEKNVCNRLADDKRKKLVRYIGWEIDREATGFYVKKGRTIKRKKSRAGTQLKPNEFSWGTKRAIAWRCKARAMASLVNIYEKEDMAKNFGARWANFTTSLWQRVTGDDLQPFLVADWHQTELLRASMVKKIGIHTARKLDKAQRWEEIERVALEEIRLSDLREFEFRKQIIWNTEMLDDWRESESWEQN